MRRRASADVVRTALFASLGLLGGCGGTFATGVAGVDGSTPGPSTGGSTPGPSAADNTPGGSADGSAPGPSTDSGMPRPSTNSNVPGDGGTCTLHPCVNPTPKIVGDVDTGYDTCQGGRVRRRAIVNCPSLLPRPSGGQCALGDAGVGDAGAGVGCVTDKDCTAGAYGHCEYSSGGQSGGPTCYCSYGCVRDSDCDALTGPVTPPFRNVCVCGDPVGYCTLGSCSSGAGCLPGCDCVDNNFGGQFTCQTPTDNCIADSDCVETPVPEAGSGGPCAISTGRAACLGASYGSPADGLHCTPVIMGCMGRPFLVGGSERRAARSARADWRASNVTPDVRALTPSVRARLTEHWLGVGLMEHASIAAFARFALHLLALGAPPDLVLLSQQAMADEIEHTRLAFSLASAYAGAEIGPDALAIDGSLDGFTVAEILATLVREGCIGETVAALEAMEALDGVRDPAVRSVLERIASDELRHAQLAWRTLSWLVASERVSRSTARRAVAAGLGALTESPRPSHTVDDEDLSELGVLGATQRERVRLAAASEVIGPCAAGLMTRHMRATSDGASVCKSV